MAASGLISIGAITVRIRKPSYNWTGSPVAHGIDAFTAGGVMQWAQAQSVLELSRNTAARDTIGGETGVKEWFVFDGDLLEPYTGYYLLQSFNLQGDWNWSGHGLDYPVAFTLTAAYLGDL